MGNQNCWAAKLTTRKKAASNFQGRLLGETGDEDDPVPGGRLSAERNLTIVLCSRGRPSCPDEIYIGMRRKSRVVEVFASIVAEVEILSAASFQWGLHVFADCP